MTIRAGCGSLVSIHERPSVNALPVELDGMCEGDFVPREKLLVAMAGGTSIGQIFLGYGRSGIA